MTNVHYIVRWKHPEKGWLVSTDGKPTEAQAMEQLARDVKYFYTSIPIQLVRVTEEIVSELRGSADRVRGVENA